MLAQYFVVKYVKVVVNLYIGKFFRKLDSHNFHILLTAHVDGMYHVTISL